MATENVTKTVSDFADEFSIQKTGALSLSCVLLDVLEENKFVCDLEINHPWHPAQQIYALVNSIKNQIDQMDVTVRSMEAAAQEVSHV